MFVRSIRTLGVIGLMGVTALVAAPLSAAGAEDSGVTTFSAAEIAKGPDLAGDIREAPATQKSAQKRVVDALASEATTLAQSTGTHEIWVSVIDVINGGNSTINPNLDQASVTAAVAAINAYWSEESAGAVEFVLGGYESKSLGLAECDPDAIWNNQADSAFGGAHSWFGQSKHLLTLTVEKSACKDGAGFGTLGGDGGLIFSASGVDAAVGLPVLYHEYGHNLGFNHANSAVCRNSSVDRPASSFAIEHAGAVNGVIPTSITCPTEEYGDILDIMGYTVSGSAPHASSYERSIAGWLPVTKPAVGKSSTVTLQSLNETSGTRAIRITDSKSGALYFVEYRTKAGRDANSIDFANPNPGQYAAKEYSGGYGYGYASGDWANGLVRVLRVLNLDTNNDGSLDGSSSTVLGVTPVSADGKDRLNSMGVGDSFVTAGGGTKITVTAMSPTNGATVKVLTAKTASKTTIKPAKSSIKKNTTSKLAITVKAVTTTKPGGKLTVYAKGKKLKTYTLSTSKSGKITVTLPKFSKKGSYSLKVKFSGSSTVADSTSKSVTLTVK